MAKTFACTVLVTGRGEMTANLTVKPCQTMSYELRMASSLVGEIGTRIIYDRKFLMECRNSPVARTPPRDLPNIPGVTSLNATEKVKPATNHVNSHEEKAAGGDDAQFEMDI
ncbi:eukaryotic translation initiation factor 4E-binding protein 1-like [Rhincodon typus]|uniref:eukaryotic translation initiation factor 4E-binding protein 1-like n=1 Tax=Rhincodon typus TaxID=259920 RepID=UPI00202F9205|nr:eukaryotic translation initiation factor 4E-binding protein 1-like [Rhincodon typus]